MILAEPDISCFASMTVFVVVLLLHEEQSGIDVTVKMLKTVHSHVREIKSSLISRVKMNNRNGCNSLRWPFYIVRRLILRYFFQIRTICWVNISANLYVPRCPEAVDLMMLAVGTKQLPNKSSWDRHIIHYCCS